MVARVVIVHMNSKLMKAEHFARLRVLSYVQTLTFFKMFLCICLHNFAALLERSFAVWKQREMKSGWQSMFRALRNCWKPDMILNRENETINKIDSFSTVERKPYLPERNEGRKFSTVVPAQWRRKLERGLEGNWWWNLGKYLVESREKSEDDS